MTVFKEAMEESDNRHPVTSIMNLRPEFIFTEQEAQAINLPTTTIG